MQFEERVARRLNRRQALFRWANGFGGLALCSLLSCARHPNSAGTRRAVAPAKNVIFLYMDGGPSQVDTFDPKPRLAREDGEPIKIATPPTQFQIGRRVLRSPFKFAKYGQCGADVSELFPHVARHVDDICFIRSMVSDHSEHTAANYCLHTGSGIQGRPSMGAWVTFGLGSQCDDLPGYVVLDGGNLPLGGADCFGSGFLPARYQGTILRHGRRPIADIEPGEPTARLQRSKIALVNELNKHALDRYAASSQFEAMLDNYELAFAMQTAVPELLDLRGESRATLRLYGVDEPHTQTFATQCLLARRLVERGVRFVQLLTPKIEDLNRWDQHSLLAEHHRKNALAVDKPIAGLLTDLKKRGLLDQTLVLWGGEFGRTPMAEAQPQGKDGRDHNPFGFTMWLAGGGVRGGTTVGATDEYGYYAVENKVHVHDLHATILHLLGIDHTQLTYPYNGRHFRLTDVYGSVVREILA
jgi:hypothetical protein